MHFNYFYIYFHNQTKNLRYLSVSTLASQNKRKRKEVGEEWGAKCTVA